MSAELFNPDQVRNMIADAITEYRAKLQDKTLSKKTLISLVESLLVDRQLIIDEIDEIKEIQEGWIPIMFRKRADFKLVLDELDESAYNDLSSLAAKLDLSPGEVLSFLMKEVVENADGTFPELSSKILEPLQKKRMLRISIHSQETLTVSHQDLVEIQAKVSFNRIDILQFVDIDLETFKTYVDRIHHCGLVQVPSSLSKLLVYAKCNHCDQIEFYDGPTPPDRSNDRNFRWNPGSREARRAMKEVREAEREVRQAEREIRQAERDIRLAKRVRTAGLGCSRRETMQLPMRNYPVALSQMPDPFLTSKVADFVPYNPFEYSKEANDQAYMLEMAEYLQNAQKYVRQAHH
ncbi:MAG: hypothetical protein ACFFGZ_07635 [Candidatus Thorarchaeota archaeon]